MTLSIQKSFTLFIFLAFISLGYSQNNEAKIDQLLNEKFKATTTGAAVIITKKGNTIYRKAFGLSNLELNTKMIPENVFEIGSMTKQFTAISILMLVEQQKISLTDEITKFIPGYPTHGQKITVHHLLNHTSGIKNYTSIRRLFKVARNDMKPLELINFFKNEPIDFNPGEKYKYNNSAYIILGYIIEKISGDTYEEFISKHIFQKINMTNSRYASHSKIIKNRAYGYSNRGQHQNAMYISFTLPYAGGSLMSTIDDLSKWQNSLNSYKLIKKETLDKAFTNYTLNNGKSIDYGYGWNVKKIGNTPSLEHGGSIFGYKSMGVYIPSKDVYVVILTNCDCISPTKLTREITALVIGENLE
ncbi:MAG: beta-lactamase family protein [Flavobacteriaceae bacterium]|nr:beta-lactamase family protein [Flavobacteriaceae bacterium]